MKNQALFSLKGKSKKIKCRLLQFLFGALRVNFQISTNPKRQTLAVIVYQYKGCQLSSQIKIYDLKRSRIVLCSLDCNLLQKTTLYFFLSVKINSGFEPIKVRYMARIITNVYDKNR